MNNVLENLLKDLIKIEHSSMITLDESIFNNFDYSNVFLASNNEFEIKSDNFTEKSIEDLINKYFKTAKFAKNLKELLKQKLFLKKTSSIFRKNFYDEKWLKEYCPFCGGKAGLGFINGEGIRYLICVDCLMRWRFRRAVCPFCLDESGRYNLFELDSYSMRVEFCDKCKGYIKTIMLNEEKTPIELDIETLDIDSWAVKKGYIKKTASMIGINFFKEETWEDSHEEVF